MTQALRTGARFPLERTAAGYTPATGADLAFSQVGYVLGTDSEGPFADPAQPWDPRFGSQLSTLPFSNLEGDALRAIVAEYVGEALAYALPQLQVENVEINKTKNLYGMNVAQITLQLRYVEEGPRGDISTRALPPFQYDIPY